jgi:phage virion morphogenesis protein
VGIVIKPAEISKRRLRRMQDRIDNLDRVWPRVGRYLSGQVRRQFSTRGAHMGTPWAPLKPEYLLWKVANGYPRSTLVMRGDLKNSFVQRPMSVEIYRKDTAVFGSDDPKAVWHQYGTKRNGKQVNPPRPMLVFTTEIKSEMVDIVRRYIRGRGPGVY